jgi:high-affinity K+ transport system ATPase subunit B
MLHALEIANQLAKLFSVIPHIPKVFVSKLTWLGLQNLLDGVLEGS